MAEIKKRKTRMYEPWGYREENHYQGGSTIEKLDYKDNETLLLSNEHEVAFGEWNVSSTDTEPSGQTVFSIGIGTSAHDRKNALEVRKDGAIYAWVEGNYIDITKILGQLAHEAYDADTNIPK